MTNDKKDKRYVGPVLRSGDFANAVIEAIQEDNSGRDIRTANHASYIRVQVQEECLIRLDTVEEMLGRPVSHYDIEANMARFESFIETSQGQFKFKDK